MRPSSAGACVLIVGLAVAGCGGGGSPVGPTSLSATGRLAIALQVVLAAMGGFAQGSGVAQADRVPLGNLTCQTTCAGSSCAISCPIDERFDCPAGGRVTDKGQIEGTLDASLSGDAPLAATQTYDACRPDATLTLNGAPSTNATGAARFIEGKLAAEQRVRITGAVDYVSTTEGSGRCSVELNVTFDRSAHGSASGMACEKPVSVAF